MSVLGRWCISFLLLFPLFWLGGCSTRYAVEAPPAVVPSPKASTPAEVLLPRAEPLAAQAPFSSEYGDLDKLYPYHNQWHLTPYQYGGLGPRGIDCSAFVQKAYRDLFGIRLPRTTRELAHYGKAVSKQQMRAGDLVFFRTGGKSRHVGIYLKEGDFMHASAKYGVIISNLAKPYWKRHYWMARRVK